MKWITQEKKTPKDSFCAKRCIQFQTNINCCRCFSLLNMSAQRGDWWWVTCHFSVLIHYELCYGFRWLTETFICESLPSISKEHNIWSCIGTEAFWKSGGKELLKVLLTLDVACLIGDISPASDVTEVARFCNSLLMISSTSSEKQVKLTYCLYESLHHYSSKRITPTQLSVSV